MQFVDKEDDVSGVGHLAEHRLEAFLEFAAKLRASHQRAHVERDHAAALEALGHVGVDDPLRKSFGNCGLSHAGLADQDRIVLRAPRQYLHHAADFLVAADDRIELALPCALDQVNAIPLERLELVLRRLVRHARAAAHGLQDLQNLLIGDRIELQYVLSLRVDLRQRQEQVFGRDELILHRVGFALGGFEHAVQLGAELRRRPAGDFGEMAQFGLDDALQLAAVDADAVEDRADDAIGFHYQRRQQVQRVDLRVAAVGRQFLRRATASWALSVSLSKRNAIVVLRSLTDSPILGPYER